MKTGRILSFTQARVMSKSEIETISGAGWTTTLTAQATYGGHPDGVLDGTWDI